MKIPPRSLLLSLLALAAGCATDSGPDGTGGGKADDLGAGLAGENATDAFFYRGQTGEAISDPGCNNCDAVGIGRSTLLVEAPLAGHVFYRATIRHPNPKDLRVSLSYNSNHDFLEPEDMGNWSEDLTGSVEDSDALVHGIRKIEGRDGCQTSAEFPDCYEITIMGDLGMQDVIGFDPQPLEQAHAVFDLDVLDLGLNGATGTIVETQLIIESPAFFM